MKQWLLIGLALSISACSSTDDGLTAAKANEVQAQSEQQQVSEGAAEGQEIAKVDNAPKQKCRIEKTIGSNRARKVCRTQKEQDAQRDAAWEYLMRSQGRNQTVNR